jgi:hypothetical protein
MVSNPFTSFSHLNVFSFFFHKRYVLYGGMQDWNYVGAGCMEVTIELSNVKYPNSATLAGHFSDNKEALLSYMELVHTGVKGTVTDSTGQPLAATITVQNRSFTTFTDPLHGNYYRLLRPGTYSITASAPGRSPQTKTVTISNGAPYEAAVLDFQL